MGTVQVDGSGADTFVGVKGEKTGGMLVGTHVDHDAMGKLFMRWLKDTPTEIRMHVISAIVLEYQVSYHLNTTSEEERLQALNLQDDEMMHKLVGAIIECIGKQAPAHVYIPDVYEKLKEMHCDLPDHVVYAVLKYWEFARKCADIGEGYFSFKVMHWYKR